jgi:hypothetical protein
LNITAIKEGKISPVRFQYLQTMKYQKYQYLDSTSGYFQKSIVPLNGSAGFSVTDKKIFPFTVTFSIEI